MLRSVVSHTTGSNCAMVRTCLALLQAAVSHTIGSNWAMVRQHVSTSLDLVRRTASGHALRTRCVWLTHHRHRQGHGAGGWLYEKSVPISDARCYGHLPPTPSAVTLTWSARIPRTTFIVNSGHRNHIPNIFIVNSFINWNRNHNRDFPLMDY